MAGSHDTWNQQSLAPVLDADVVDVGDPDRELGRVVVPHATALAAARAVLGDPEAGDRERALSDLLVAQHDTLVAYEAHLRDVLAVDPRLDDGSQRAVRPAPGGTSKTSESSEPVYGSLDEWVEKWLAPFVGRRQYDTDNTFAWCLHWADHHGDAVWQLQALWEAWEEMATGDAGTGKAEYLIRWLWPILGQLTDALSGPFARCGGKHDRTAHMSSGPLPTKPGDE